jgi:hypothetical protein
MQIIQFWAPGPGSTAGLPRLLAHRIRSGIDQADPMRNRLLRLGGAAHREGPARTRWNWVLIPRLDLAGG